MPTGGADAILEVNLDMTHRKEAEEKLRIANEALACQRVVDRYGGDIWVDSQVNEGATFSFTLPAAAKGAAAHEA